MEPFRKLPGTFCAESLVRDLEVVEPHEWKRVPVFGADSGIDWSGAALRSHDGCTTTLDYQGSAYRDTPLMARLPYVRSVIGSFACETRRVRLLSLQPGAVIGTHRDAMHEGFHEIVRLHVPIVTNDAVSFVVAGQDLVMRPGELWFVDVSQPHSVANRGAASRVHLVLDCVVNEWLFRVFSGASGMLGPRCS